MLFRNAIGRRFLTSEAGNIAIITGLMLPVLAGFIGLGVETSYWYYRHQSIQDAADIAAYGGAVVLTRGGSDAELAAAARADAITNGWRAESGSISVTRRGPFVDVLLTEYQPRYFSQFVCGPRDVPISAHSRAVGVRGQQRVRLLSTEGAGNSKRNESVAVTGCSDPDAGGEISAKDEATRRGS